MTLSGHGNYDREIHLALGELHHLDALLII